MILRRLIPVVVLLVLASCEQTHRSASSARPQDDPEESIRRQVESCWTIDPGLPGLENMTVSIKVELDQDGTVTSASPVVDDDKLSDPNYRKFVESAMRAVLQCGPYKFPASTPYDEWKIAFFDFKFDPRLL